MIKLASLIFIFLLTIFQLAPLSQDAEQKSDHDERVKESVFRYQIQMCSPKNTDSIFFLSDKGKDLSDKFMALFKDIDRPVKKQSSSNSASIAASLVLPLLSAVYATIGTSRLCSLPYLPRRFFWRYFDLTCSGKKSAYNSAARRFCKPTLQTGFCSRNIR